MLIIFLWPNILAQMILYAALYADSKKVIRKKFQPFFNHALLFFKLVQKWTKIALENQEKFDFPVKP